jgi:hypothetical protein
VVMTKMLGYLALLNCQRPGVAPTVQSDDPCGTICLNSAPYVPYADFLPTPP